MATSMGPVEWIVSFFHPSDLYLIVRRENIVPLMPQLQSLMYVPVLGSRPFLSQGTSRVIWRTKHKIIVGNLV